VQCCEISDAAVHDRQLFGAHAQMDGRTVRTIDLLRARVTIGIRTNATDKSLGLLNGCENLKLRGK